MRRWLVVWTWLHQPPRGTVTGWRAQYTIFLWTVPTWPLSAAVGALFGLSSIAFSFVGIVFAAGVWGWWLRTGRHWHPLKEGFWLSRK